LLSEELEDKKLARFYKKLMISEANHYTMFLQFARTYGGREQTNQKWKALLAFEGELIKSFGKKETIHG
jgi:tRNA-(ms[2]io[6]A)-hydroxylase